MEKGWSVRGEGEMECEGGWRDREHRRVRGRYWWGVMEGGRAHLGLLLPMSAFVCRQWFSFAGGHSDWKSHLKTAHSDISCGGPVLSV